MEATISIFPVLLIAIIFIVGIVVGVVVLAVTLGNRSKQKILAQQQQQQPAVGYACPYCGAALPAGAAVCPACGRPLGGQQE